MFLKIVLLTQVTMQLLFFFLINEVLSLLSPAPVKYLDFPNASNRIYQARYSYRPHLTGSRAIWLYQATPSVL
jgi:hypothetical protein